MHGRCALEPRLLALRFWERYSSVWLTCNLHLECKLHVFVFKIVKRGSLAVGENRLNVHSFFILDTACTQLIQL